MAITSQIRAILKDFQKENPDSGRILLGDGTLSTEEQLEFILDPRRPKTFPKLKKKFRIRFHLQDTPTCAELTEEQIEWWTKTITKQAAKPTGFPHVAGRAQDVWIKKLPPELRGKLRAEFLDAGFGVFNEYISKTRAQLDVSLNEANLLHVYKK